MIYPFRTTFFTFLIISCNSSESLTATSVIPVCLKEKIKKMSADMSEGRHSQSPGLPIMAKQ